MLSADELRTLGESQRRKPGTDGGVAAYEQAVALLRGGGDAIKLAHTIRHLGDVHVEQGRPEVAGPLYDEALALYRGHPAPPRMGLANAIRSQAVLKEQLGHPDEAAELWAEARELYAAEGVQEGVDEAAERLLHLRRG